MDGRDSVGLAEFDTELVVFDGVAADVFLVEVEMQAQLLVLGAQLGDARC
jgi:hypothetical protein